MLSAAQVLIDEPAEELSGSWPRGAAVLTRQAIESTVTYCWKHTVPDMQWTNWAAQWAALPSYLGDDQLVADAHYAWEALSDVCHHRGYDLGLTEAELRRHLGVAKAFARLVASRLEQTAAA